MQKFPTENLFKNIPISTLNNTYQKKVIKM